MSSTDSNPTTPTSQNVSSSNSSISSGLEDVQHLLYLETLKRFKEDEANIKRQVEEKTRQYQEFKSEYLDLYYTYVSLVKLSATHCALEQETPIDATHCQAAKENISRIIEKITTNNMTDFVNPEAVAQCKENINSLKNHDKLRQMKEELANNKAAIKAIQAASDAVEATLETATLQGLDYFIDEIAYENSDAI